MWGTVLRVLGLGAVVATVSEVWFYPIDLTSSALALCLFYGPLCYMAWLVMSRLRVSSWMGAFWAACLAGFFIEGIPVPVLYEAIPFTILWTSISWHAIISIALGLWAFRHIAARKPIWVTGVWCVLAGLYLGAWSVELWSVREDGSPWRWTPADDFATQMFIGWAAFVVGHVLLDLAARFTTRPWRGELALFAILTGGLFALGPLTTVFPLSLFLPVLTALSVWLMSWDTQAQGALSPFLVRLSNLRVPVLVYVVSALIPVSATLAYGRLLSADIQLESAALHILWAGPVSIGLILYSGLKLIRRSSAAM